MSTVEERMINAIEELEQENRLLRARNERLERESEMRRLALLDNMQATPVQEPLGTYGEIFNSMLLLLRSGTQRDQQIYMAMQDKPLYTSPPAAQRQWVGLTEQQKLSLEIQGGKSDVMLAELVEGWLKEKNT